ncbi:TPA: hypothetical protein U1425_001339, partial [Streptococcus suis]|nr:hypothetical protein [Streptococcus suis]
MNDCDLKDFVGKNFADELPDDDSKIMIHFHTMILELGSIIAALEIVKIVNDEWHDRVVQSSIRYDIVRNVTYESLFYRVVFGITKIFDVREKNGIFKILSKLRHSTKDRSLLSILSTIQEGIDKEQKNIDEIKLLRDKLLAHLDKEMVFSTERLDIGILYYYFEAIEIKSIYTAC